MKSNYFIQLSVLLRSGVLYTLTVRKRFSHKHKFPRSNGQTCCEVVGIPNPSFGEKLPNLTLATSLTRISYNSNSVANTTSYRAYVYVRCWITEIG